MKIDRRFRNGFLITNSYTLGKGESYDGGDSNGPISTPADIERSWDARSTTAGTPSSAASSTGCRSRMMAGSASSPTAGRSPGSSPPSRALPWTSPWTVPCCRRPATRSGRIVRDPEVLGNVGSGQPVVRHGGVRGAGAEHVRQPDPQRRRRQRARLLQPRRLGREEVPFGSKFAEFRVDGANITNSLHPNNPNTTFGSATFGQIPARSIHGWSASACASCLILPSLARPRTIDEYSPRWTTTPAGPSVRASIKTAPKAEETISYGFPAFRLNGKVLACFRGASAHCSYHPMSGRIVAANRAALGGYETSTGTVRFPIGAPLPARIVRLLVKARIAEMEASTAKKPTSRRPRP